MAIRPLVLAALLVVGWPVWLPVEGQQRKPMIEVPFHVDRRSPPQSLSELVNNVDLVAHVRILSAEPKRRRFPEGPGYAPETLFVAEIVERGRARRHDGGVEPLRVVQDGGEFEEPDRIERRFEENNPPLVAGRSYLLALNWNEFLKAYVLPYGPDSIFEIERGRVQPRGKGRGARELTGLDLKEALRRIR